MMYVYILLVCILVSCTTFFFDLGYFLKILYIISTLKCSGPTSQLYNLIKYLDRSQFEPYILTLSPEPVDSCWDDYEALDIQGETLGLSRLEGVLLAQKRILGYVHRIQPDLIHTQGIRGDMFSAVLNYPGPRICTIRNFPQKDYLMTYGSLLGRWMVAKHVYAMRKMDICIGVSKAVCVNLGTVFNLKKSSLSRTAWILKFIIHWSMQKSRFCELSWAYLLMPVFGFHLATLVHVRILFCSALVSKLLFRQ